MGLVPTPKTVDGVPEKSFWDKVTIMIMPILADRPKNLCQPCVAQGRAGIFLSFSGHVQHSLHGHYTLFLR